MLTLNILLPYICIVSVTYGIFIREGCDSYLPQDYFSSQPLSKWNMDYGRYSVLTRVTTVQEEVGILVPQLLTNSTDKDWQTIVTSLVQFMADGLSLYHDILYANIETAGRMFDGDYNFKQCKRCNALENQDFSQSGYFSEFAAALGKDLPCFSALLSDVYALKLNGYTEECISTEDEAIEFIADVVRVLFRLRNTGDRFFHNIASKAKLDTTGLHDHFIKAFNGTDGIAARRTIRNFDTA